MTRLNLIGALAAAGAALLLALGPTSATEYSNNPNPACRTMRNNTPGLPFPPEPNREDTRKAQLLWGGDPSFLGNSPYARKQYGQAFALLQKVDGEGTDALAALPPNTPRIDLVIDRHVSNLMVARLMVAAFYEQGRLGNPDPAQAAAFYQKAIDTNYTDDRGCVHATPIIDAMRNRYVAVLVYDLRTPEAHAKALDVLRDGGPKFESALYLLGKNMLPMQRYEYFEADLDAMAEDLRHPPPTQADLILALLARIALWCAIALVLVVGAVGVARAVRRRLGYKDEASLYRTVFAVYDALRHVVARFGLVAEGLIGCFIGLSIVFGGYALGGFGSGVFGGSALGSLGTPYDLIILVSGASAFLGGVAKLFEAARLSSAPNNTRVHGSARPAPEPEAQAAAQGGAKTADLHDRTFSD